MTGAKIKRLTGQRAVDLLVRSGMKLGLGTGSTAIEVIRSIARRVKEGALRDLLAVPTSFQAQVEAVRLGLSLRALDDPAIHGRLDLTIDGADEVDPRWHLVKGGGGAMMLEKILACASRDYAIVVDEDKLVARLGERSPVPVEIVPQARLIVSRELEALGGSVALRQARQKSGPVITDHGNFILDVRFANPFDPGRMERQIKGLPGVMAVGIFTQRVNHLLIGRMDGRVEHRTKK